MRHHWARSPSALSTLFVAAAVFVVLGAPYAPHAHAISQVALTVSYNVVGGSSPQAADLLTYVNNGQQLVVALSSSPTVYMADTGSNWQVQTVLNGSTFNERWLSSNGTVSGTIGAPLTVHFRYYHQYRVTFNFNVIKGGTGYGAPSVSYTAIGSPASSNATGSVWVDSGSAYNYPASLPGSSSTERWVPEGTIAGSITSPTSVTVTYDHQFLVTSSYSIIGGGSPSAPVLTSTVAGAPNSVTMTVSTQQTWFDAGANYSFTPALSVSSSSTKEAWPGTEIVQTQSGNVLTKVFNGTFGGPLTIAPVYWHQFLVNVTFVYIGGSPTGLKLPSITYTYFGSQNSLNATKAVWIDAGTQFVRPQSICCPNSPSSERWELYNFTMGAINAPTVLSSTYFHQYYEGFSYSVSGQQPPSPSSQPSITYIAGGNAQKLSMLMTPQSAWADASSSYKADSALSASASTERWFATFATGNIVGPAPNDQVVVTYYHQYLIQVVGNGPPSQWANAGNNETVYLPGFFGRSQGTGYRVTAYQVDNGAMVPVAQPALLLPVLIGYGSHTIQVEYVIQFQVSLDAGASGALHYITPTPITGDSYWFDSGAQIQVVLNGTWGRANGIGQRIVSISASAEPLQRVSTVGLVQAYNTTSLDSPVSITTTSVTQYEVVLNSAAKAAMASISPPSTFPGDTFWYDAGSPAVTVALSGEFSRSSGMGLRTTSWELDSGSITKVATTGQIMITTASMTGPHFITATTTVQYQLTIDAGTAAATSALTGPSIPLDQGWYDASTPIGLVLNGEWGRAAGTGHRLVGYSVDGGVVTPVASTGLVTVLNLPGITAPIQVNTTVVTQYQVVLDSGATSALSTITPTSIPLDKGWYDSGTQVSVVLNGVWGRTATGGSRLVSYSVDQGASKVVLSSSPVQVLALSSIVGPQSISAKIALQYHLTSSPLSPVSMTNSTLLGDSPGWFDAGTAVKATFDNVWNLTSSGTRDSIISYTVDGTGKTTVARIATGNFTVSVTMNAAHSIALTSVTQYLLTVTGPPKFTTSPASPTGDSFFDMGSKVAVSVPSAWNGTGTAKSEARGMLVTYSVDGGPPLNASAVTSPTFTTKSLTFNQPHSLLFQTVVVYEVSFQFLDGLGRNTVAPTAVQLGVGNSTILVQGQTAWLPNGTSFKVQAVIWESASVGPTAAPSYQVTGAPLNVTVDTRIYPASLRALDLFGLPVSGAQIAMTLANGTVVTGTTRSDGTYSVGMIPLGTFTAKVTSLGLTTNISQNSADQQAAEGKVPLSLISLFAIVAAAAAAGSGGFLFYRRSKRKRLSKPRGQTSS